MEQLVVVILIIIIILAENLANSVENGEFNFTRGLLSSELQPWWGRETTLVCLGMPSFCYFHTAEAWGVGGRPSTSCFHCFFLQGKKLKLAVLHARFRWSEDSYPCCKSRLAFPNKHCLCAVRKQNDSRAQGLTPRSLSKSAVA